MPEETRIKTFKISDEARNVTTQLKLHNRERHMLAKSRFVIPENRYSHPEITVYRGGQKVVQARETHCSCSKRLVDAVEQVFPFSPFYSFIPVTTFMTFLPIINRWIYGQECLKFRCFNEKLEGVINEGRYLLFTTINGGNTRGVIHQQTLQNLVIHGFQNHTGI